jgi:hypothetical protein
MPAKKKTPDEHARDIKQYARVFNVTLKNVRVNCEDFKKRKWKYYWTYKNEDVETDDKVRC